MPPPPLPLRTTPFGTNQLPATMPPQHYAPAPSKAPTHTHTLTNPANDPILFTDPRFKFEVNSFWENPVGSNMGFTGSSAVGFNDNSSYSTPNDFIPRYNPTDNDLQIYKQQDERFAESESELLEKKWRHKLELLLKE
jgi:hypothetical protein